MNLYLIGHDYRYAAEQMLLTLFPDERPEYPDGRPTGDRAELRLMSGTKVTTVTCVLVYHGQTANGRTSVPNGELTDPAETDRRLQGAVKRAFTAPPWASGCRAGRGACSRACAPESS